MIGPLQHAGPHPPKVRGENDHRQQKKDAGHLQPQNAADATEGAQKPAYSPDNASARLPRNPPGRAALLGIYGDWLARPSAGRGLRLGRHVLAGHATRDPQADAQGPTDGLRFHFEYDGSSDHRGRAFSSFFALPSCSKVESEVR